MYGELGLGARCVAKEPTIINFQRKQRPFITQISAGSSHSLLLSRQGRVFSFGSNRHGRLGLGDEEARIRPCPLVINNEKIVQVSAGDAHSLLLSSKGNVYSFGCGTHGQLGLANDHSNFNRPTLLHDFSNRVARICASHTRSRLLLKDGRVVLFGGDVGLSSSSSSSICSDRSKEKKSESEKEMKCSGNSVGAVGTRLILPEFTWGTW